MSDVDESGEPGLGSEDGAQTRNCGAWFRNHGTRSWKCGAQTWSQVFLWSLVTLLMKPRPGTVEPGSRTMGPGSESVKPKPEVKSFVGPGRTTDEAQTRNCGAWLQNHVA